MLTPKLKNVLFNLMNAVVFVFFKRIPLTDP